MSEESRREKSEVGELIFIKLLCPGIFREDGKNIDPQATVSILKKITVVLGRKTRGTCSYGTMGYKCTEDFVDTEKGRLQLICPKGKQRGAAT